MNKFTEITNGIANWMPPVPYPDDGDMYTWDEETQTWVAIDAPD